MERIFDLHNDCLVEKRLTQDECGVDGNSVTVTHAIFTRGLALRDYLDCKRRALAKNLLFSVEDCSIFTARDYCHLRGALMASLTWNGDNALAGGALGQGRLSADGKRLIAILEQEGIALDLAHLNRPSFFDALSVARRPPLVSHCGLSEMRDHPRNLTGEQVRALTECGGVVGLCLVAHFYRCTGAQVLLEAIDRYCQRYSPDTLCIGTDFCGTDRYVDGIAENDYEGLSAVLDGLRSWGYDGKTLRGICYANFFAYLDRSGIQIGKNYEGILEGFGRNHLSDGL